MRKIVIGAAMVAALAMPASALAQNPAPVVTGDVKAAKHKLSFKVVNSAASKTTVKNLKLALPSGVKLDGKGLKTCKLSALENGARPRARRRPSSARASPTPTSSATRPHPTASPSTATRRTA